MTAEMYTVAQMRHLLSLAEELGFWDDVQHWKAEIARAEKSGGVS
jgi:hypothetical protein